MLILRQNKEMWIGFEYKKIDVQGSLQENVEIYDMVKIKKILFMEEFLNYFLKKKIEIFQ